MKTHSLAFVFTFLASISTAHADKFTNQFCEFELPPKWECNLEGAEWVCQGKDIERRRDAIIILAAKLRGDQDSLDQYLTYLKQAKSFVYKNQPVKSDSKYAKIDRINEHAWVDSLHLESELPGYYTRYLATIKEDIAVLVTYSVKADKYKTYLQDFENMIRTLRVFRRPGGINAGAQQNLFDKGKIPQGPVSVDTVFPGAGEPDSGSKKPQASAPFLDDTTFYLLLGCGILAFLIWKRRRG